MNWIKELKNKTWIDWVKILVAIDIASVGIGLILGMPFHVLAGVLGFISRFLFGVMYVFVAVLILKRIFPTELSKKETNRKKDVNFDIKKGLHDGKRIGKKIIDFINFYSDKVIDIIDDWLDIIESFFYKKKEELKKEVKKLVDDK